MRSQKSHWFVLLAVGTVVATTGLVYSHAPVAPMTREELRTEFNNGNFKDAYDGLRRLCLDPRTERDRVSEDLNLAAECLTQLGRANELDELLESTIKVQAMNWRLLTDAAARYMAIPHHGFLIAGEFRRGDHAGGGKLVNAYERDRVRALQLLMAAVPLTRTEENKPDVGQFYLRVSDAWLNGRGVEEAWRLQSLTDLAVLPDYDVGYQNWRPFNGAPVDADGNPVLHRLPESMEQAISDGQRWRWALSQAIEHAPGLKSEVAFRQAAFYQAQFGVETMARDNFFGRAFAIPDEDDKNESGVYAIHTLAETETIAKLAVGIKRFELPDEFNPIRLYQQLAARTGESYSLPALMALADIFENRRQYPRAAEYWRKVLQSQTDKAFAQQRLDQIIGNWGTFEPLATQPKGKGASVEFRFRNGKKLELEAHAIRVDKLLADAKSHLKSNPRQLDGTKISLEDIGWRLVQESESRYIGERVANWALDLEPREGHFDRRITVATPLQKPGAYLLKARMADGNVSQIIVWVSDAAIVKKPMSNQTLYYVADSVTGKPIANANVEFFGYQQTNDQVRNNTVTSNFAETTDANGQIVADPRDLKPQYNWIAIARRGNELIGYLGFNWVWYSPYYDQAYNEVKIFCITDRPVYRPKQKAHIKLWVRQAQYDMPNVSKFAGQSLPVVIFNPQGEKVYEQTLKADDWAGLEAELELPESATLGIYSIQVLVQDGGNQYTGGGSFRVEEYKKPEFEVTVDSPKEPVMLGEKITATINAAYYFGGPVTEATVKYKITRAEHDRAWFPHMPWDWCYGPGYWWFAYDYAWYPGWGRWAGCMRPRPWWWSGPRNPPELIAEIEVPIGEDGRVDVQIDTALAKELHGDLDHEYTITAEVRDASRRTIVGEGKVLVARRPFRVYTWVDRGYYRVGDNITAHFLAQTLDNKPVQGQGKLTLFKISYNDQNQPVESVAQQWQLDTDDEGRATQPLRATAKGQYRLSYQVTDAQQHAVEGGYLFTIIGDGFDGSDYRFNEIELIPDRREYKPGDKVQLQVNTNRIGGTVLLFVRAANGIYLLPKTILLTGKSTVEEIGVIQKDMPNFFVEAVTVADGKVHSEVKEIVVPPEKRVLNVAVKPSAKEYKPGEQATVQLRLTDHTGENYVGSTVVAIYDKAVEYVSGGSNVGDIKEFFWKWRRQHQSSQETNLSRGSYNLTRPNEPGMAFLGVFGQSVADDLESDGNSATKSKSMTRGAFGGVPGAPGGGGGGPEMLMMDAASAAPGPTGEPMSRMAKAEEAENAAPSGATVGPTLRTNFADTALWIGALTTDSQGLAEVKLEMPENLTTWKVKVWGMGHGTRVGSGDAEVITRKNLIVRMQAPRFFVQKDEVVLSANVHNYLPTDKEATVVLELAGKRAVGAVGDKDASPLESVGEPTQKVRIPAGGETRVDWRVRVVDEGTVVLRMKALTDEESDAVEMSFPSYVHGMLKTESWAGTVRPDQDQAQVTVVVPAERRPEQSLLEVRYSPTLAGAMVDALPYLADYPYGCTEQTLNRFLPSVITQKVLLDMNLNLAAIRDKRTNLNAQELGDDRERAGQWKRFEHNPVFDQDELGRMVKEGVKRLTDMQNEDGGWGWFSGTYERSWPHTTAVVVHGLQIASHNDVPLVPGMLERGVEWLRQHQDAEVQKLKNFATKTEPYKRNADHEDAFVYMVLVDAGIDNTQMRELLYRDRNELAVYAKALLAMAVHKVGDDAKLKMLVRNIEQFLVQDEENETAYLKLPANNYWWFWWGSEAEANAYYLKLLARMGDQSPKAPRLVKYLLNNRKHATYWSNTRDTAICVEAFADYLRASDELRPQMAVEVWVDGTKKQDVTINPDNLFTFDNKFVLSGAAIQTGSHVVELRRRGRGPVYFNAYLTNFTLEDPITRAGLEVRVNRKYYRLDRVDKKVQAETRRGSAVEQKVEKYQRTELQDLSTVKSGELVEIELVLDSKNDYEYLMFEDLKPAGFEPVEIRSGYTGNELGAYTEFRDNRVSFFVHRMARGQHSVSYRMRAEVPGKFSALPARVHAMYAPELVGNSDELKLQIVD